jgi:general stress protein 26
VQVQADLRDIEKTVGNLADKAGLFFVGSVDADGNPNIKGMFAARKREGIKRFYLSTNTSSLRVSQFRENPKACLYFCDRRFFHGVMLVGSMAVLEDAQSKALIWRDGDTLYYPLGVTDPDYCVLLFTAVSGRYYSNFKSENFAIP